MARVKGAMMTRKRRNKTLKLAKGYWGNKSRHFKMANEQVMKSDLRLRRPPPEEERFPLPVDHSYLRSLQAQRHELLHVHARPEDRRHRD